MQRRKFGNTGLEVSAICLGCWPFGVDWWGHYTEADAVRMCNFAYNQGITYFDNGDAYGNGRAETSFAGFLKTVPRDRVEIGGKFGYDFYSDPGVQAPMRNANRIFLRNSCASLWNNPSNASAPITSIYTWLTTSSCTNSMTTCGPS